MQRSTLLTEEEVAPRKNITRVYLNGKVPGFHPDYGGSTPPTRSNFIVDFVLRLLYSIFMTHRFRYEDRMIEHTYWLMDDDFGTGVTVKGEYARLGS